MTCADSCPLEQFTQHSESGGVVLDSEYICRAAFDPDDLDRARVVKPRIIPNSHFFERNEISVWRIASPDASTLKEIVQLIKLDPSKRVDRFMCVEVHKVRSLHRQQSNCQRLCVLDECEIDRDGNTDPRHAHVSRCRYGIEMGNNADDPRLQATLLAVRNLFRYAHSVTV